MSAELSAIPAIPVLHLERAFAVIDKPAGLPVEADSPEAVVKVLAKQLAPAGGGRAWPRVVHRLDRDTSGCLAIALNDAGAKFLLGAFEAGEVRKEYLALIGGALPDEGEFDTAYGPDPRDKRRFTTQIETPRRARLRWVVSTRLRGCALVRVWLDTGRTHQIRVQFAEEGFPVLGDAVYGGKGEALSRECGMERQALHAARLSFPRPDGGERLECVAPVPADFAAAMALLK